MIKSRQKIFDADTKMPEYIVILIGTSMLILMLYICINLLIIMLAGPIERAVSLNEIIAHMSRSITVCSESGTLVVLNIMLVYGVLMQDQLEIMYNLFLQIVVVLYTFWINMLLPWEVYTVLLMVNRIVYLVYLLCIPLQIYVSRQKMEWAFFKNHGASIELNNMYMIRRSTKIAYKVFVILFLFRWSLSIIMGGSLVSTVVDICVFWLQVLTGLYIDIESYALRWITLIVIFGLCVYDIVLLSYPEIFISTTTVIELDIGGNLFAIWICFISLILFLELVYGTLLLIDIRSFGKNLYGREIKKERKRLLVDWGTSEQDTLDASENRENVE
ncbi:hypothetical protein NEFER03_2207 [Nematocida sp. LUAm3]|nr:hypothetical protein NEAUS07_2520 [Nematocida ausubeli]KAI5171231.1 hypothetical protein NEFER03_0633 [Nematocida sp. LUAm3]KAI5176427.1 hypothetical protein NEFER02_2190 [Nematocida sp. LUAm2]KAI5179290.1 hypothetical protein NEFER01_2139 [Nematocida sp. LUAm1]KAI5171852.1 hypothetical protein NEFER03_1117 [Nematocida sp. LUAm3]